MVGLLEFHAGEVLWFCLQASEVSVGSLEEVGADDVASCVA